VRVFTGGCVPGNDLKLDVLAEVLVLSLLSWPRTRFLSRFPPEESPSFNVFNLSYTATHGSSVKLLTFGTMTVLSSHAAVSRPRK
jgi:hypothetical protein